MRPLAPSSGRPGIRGPTISSFAKKRATSSWRRPASRPLWSSSAIPAASRLPRPPPECLSPSQPVALHARVVADAAVAVAAVLPVVAVGAELPCTEALFLAPDDRVRVAVAASPRDGERRGGRAERGRGRRGRPGGNRRDRGRKENDQPPSQRHSVLQNPARPSARPRILFLALLLIRLGSPEATASTSPSVRADL